MDIIKKCIHQYIPGYSLRVPHPFFRSVKCDHCNKDITLSLGWRIIFFVVQFGGFIFALAAADIIVSMINFGVSGLSFLVEVVIVTIVFYCVERLSSKILERSNWVLKGK